MLRHPSVLGTSNHGLSKTMTTMADLSDFIPADEIAEAIKGNQVHQAKLELAQRGVDYAKSIAPVDTGKYRDLIEVEDDDDEVYVAFNDEISAIIEYGTEDTPEFAVLARTEAYINRIG